MEEQDDKGVLRELFVEPTKARPRWRVELRLRLSIQRILWRIGELDFPRIDRAADPELALLASTPAEQDEP